MIDTGSSLSRRESVVAIADRGYAVNDRVYKAGARCRETGAQCRRFKFPGS
jgi:hypothetical protein